MLTDWWIKPAIALAVVSLFGAFVTDYIRTKQENAVAEKTVEATTVALQNYAFETEAEIEGWKEAATILSEKFQLADEVASDARKRITTADFEKMASRHPDMLARRINTGTTRVLNRLEAISRATGKSRPSEPSETKTP